MLTKNIDGKEVVCSESEEREIREIWAKNEIQYKQEAEKVRKRMELAQTYGDIYECIDILFKHLNLKKDG